MVRITPRPFYSRGKSRRHPRNRRQGGLRCGYGHEEKQILALAGNHIMILGGPARSSQNQTVRYKTDAEPYKTTVEVVYHCSYKLQRLKGEMRCYAEG